MQVRIASPADIGDVATLFAAAFHDDPWFGWTFPDRTARRRQLTAFMARLVGSTAARPAPPGGSCGR